MQRKDNMETNDGVEMKDEKKTALFKAGIEWVNIHKARIIENVRKSKYPMFIPKLFDSQEKEGV